MPMDLKPRQSYRPPGTTLNLGVIVKVSIIGFCVGLLAGICVALVFLQPMP